MLDYIWQNQGVFPSEVMNKTPGERAFLFASTLRALEEGNIPVKLRNFAKKKEG